MVDSIRNIAIIAHIDHGKTTLVDKLLQQSGAIVSRNATEKRVMDSNELEKERGITILAKNTSLTWKGVKINIVDTPGHADFGGEVERVMSMVDSVLLIVDAVEGPMPQTRFVTEKAFSHGLKPIVLVNKIDRPSSRPDWVIDQVFDLFDSLGANDEQLDFSVVYCSALEGYATCDLAEPKTDMDDLFNTIIAEVPPPNVQIEEPFQLQISLLEYSNFIGVIGIGRIQRGYIEPNTQVSIVNKQGEVRFGKILQIMEHVGLERSKVSKAQAGDIVAIAGIEDLHISDTVCHKEHPEALPCLHVDEPTMCMTFQVNDSPFAGQEGDFVTSRKIRERLQRELKDNIALQVIDTEDPDKFLVYGRGELHLCILIENMRREGFELSVSQPRVIYKEDQGVKLEPFERVLIVVFLEHQGTIIQDLAERGGELANLSPEGTDRVRLEFTIPTRGLIGFHSKFLTLTSGTGVLSHVFERYDKFNPNLAAGRRNGVLVVKEQGTASAYGLWNLQSRGSLLIGPQVEVYEGMIIGIHSRDNDLVVNPTKEKQLTNMRASGKDESIILTPPIKLTLEKAIDFINSDELVEITPKSIRIRKKLLKEHERRRASRS